MIIWFLITVDSIIILLFFAACCYSKSISTPILNNDNYIKYDTDANYIKYDMDEEYIIDIVPDNEEF